MHLIARVCKGKNVVRLEGRDAKTTMLKDHRGAFAKVPGLGVHLHLEAPVTGQEAFRLAAAARKPQAIRFVQHILNGTDEAA